MSDDLQLLFRSPDVHTRTAYYPNRILLLKVGVWKTPPVV